MSLSDRFWSKAEASLCFADGHKQTLEYHFPERLLMKGKGSRSIGPLMKAKRANDWIAIAANIGVIASVIFLALEIQQNTLTNRAQAVQEFHRDMRDSLLNPDERLADIIHRAYSCEPVSIIEQNFRRLAWERLIRTYENQWYQRQQGLIDPLIYEGYQSYWRITVGWGDSEWWPPKEGVFHPGFVEAMSDYLDEHGREVPGTFNLLNREKCTDLDEQ